MRVEGMAHEIKMALLQHELDISSEMQRAITELCRPEHVRAVVKAEAARAMELVIRDEVERFYRHGDGRQAVREVVEARLRDSGVD
jgi:hypothetical protein